MLRRLQSPPLFTLSILIILLLAFGLRVAKLGDSAIWWDEAWSIWVAQQPFDQTTHMTASDVHPPLYQWALHGWIRLAGISAFSARYLSLLAGLLTVALVYALARRLGGRYAGLIALLCTAISPFFIHWSQEARMYALGALFTALAVYAYVRVREDWHQVQWWVALIIAGASVPLTQYLGALTLILINLHIILTFKRSQIPFYMRWVMAMGATGLILMAWVIYAIGLTRTGSADSGADPAFVFQLASVLWSSGTSLYITDYQWAGVAFVVIYAIGLMLYARRDRSSVILVVLFAIVPPLLIYVLGILETRFYAPKPEERYFILFAPLVFVGIGLAIKGLGEWRRVAGAVALCAVVVSYGMGVWRDYDRRYLQDDYLTLFNMVDALAQPDEPIFFISDDRYPLVYYHLNRASGWETPYTVQGIQAFDEEGLLDLIANQTSYWVVFIEPYLADPDNQVMAWFDQNQTATYQASFGHNRVLYFGDHAPESSVILAPPATEFRPHDIIHMGGANIHAQLQYQGKTVFEQSADSWQMLHFPIDPAYPSGDYQVILDDQIYPITITNAGTSTHPQHIVEADFGDLTLRGYTLKNSRTQAGGTFEIVLHWRVNAVSEHDYTGFAQLIGPFRETGPVWANDDRYPAQTPTSRLWQGLEFDDVRYLDVPDVMPTGTYEAYFGLYRLETGERLTDQNGADFIGVGGLVVD